MKKYDEYKDSGVEWIGEVPSHWEVVKIKQVCKNEKYAIKTGPFGTQLKGQELQPEGDVVVYNQRNVIDNSFDNVQFYVTKEKAKSLSSFYTKPGDILVTSRGTIGRAAILEGKYPMGILHPCLIAIRLNENKCLQKWLMTYVNETNCFKTDVTLSSNATTIDVIYTETLKNIAIPIPPLYEQQTIATYLDKKCGEIDKVISAQQKRIALLQELKQSIITHAVTKGLDPNVEMKDSGVEWIGKVPKHWEVMKTSLAFHGIGSGTTPSTSKPEFYNEETGKYWLQTGDLNDGVITDTSKKVTELAIKTCNLKSYPKDSVVIAMYGATIGKVGILGITSATNQACCVLPKSKNMSSKYAFYEFLACKPALLVSAIGGGQPNISQDTIKKQKIVVPPFTEQQTIATYLDKKCASIDSSISKAQHQVALLQEYKQSLITEVVTGKRKVC